MFVLPLPHWSLVSIVAFTLAGCLAAAPVSWQPPFNLTAVTDLDLSGTLVRAVNATTDGQNPVVTVGAETILFRAENLGPNGTGTGGYFTGDGGDTGDAPLNEVLDSHVWNGGEWSFTLTGLTPGKQYQLQLIGAGDTRPCCSDRNQRAGDGEPEESISGDFSRSGTGSVIGRFTAAASTQPVRILPGIVNGTDPGLSGYILRELSPAAPQPPENLVLSPALVAPGAGPGTTVGTLTVTDTNAGDIHTFSLVNDPAFPSTSLFQIVGSLLQVASPDLAPDKTYPVRVRVTDSTSLTLESTVTVTVQAATAPSSLEFSSTTLLSTAPANTVAGTLSTVDATTHDIHTYSLVPGPDSTHNDRFLIKGNSLLLTTTPPPNTSRLFVRVRSTDLSGLFVESSISLTIIENSLIISEFLAENTPGKLTDEDLEAVDWIELHNPSPVDVNLAGWTLTDDPLTPNKWVFPALTLPAGGYRIVFASGKNRTPLTGNVHTNFRLDALGEYLGLFSPAGAIASEFGSAAAGYPPQAGGVSYGVFGPQRQTGYMLTPTPQAANNAASGVAGLVADTKFSNRRGFHPAPFDLTITTATPGASIRYTTDGSWPTESKGTLYTTPIRITRSQPVKAIAFKTGWRSTNVDTHTYVLVDEVVTQTQASVQTINGLPATWKGTAAYYGMNGNNSVVNPATHPTLKQDLQAVPSLSIAIDAADMFGGSGIYANPTSTGAAWERKTSLELIDPAAPDGSRNFQENCVIQIQGGAFRDFGLTRKKSFRITMKPDFGTAGLPSGGPGRLDYALFGPGAASSFNTFILRMESNDGWQWSGAGGKPQFARDQFARRAMQELGQPAPSGRYLHVYINGVYWGLYNAVERPDASFAENYLGANPDLWQGQNSGQPINGATNLADWNSMLSVVDDITAANTPTARDIEYLQSCGFTPDGTRSPSTPVWIDPTNFADYLLVNWYAGNSDWPFKNYYGGRAREPDSTGFKFFMWDCEWSLLLQSSPDTDRTNDFSGIAAPQNHLEKSPEYRLRFADRAFRALLNDGPLTPSRARALYDEVTAQHRSILIPESARWGNQHGGRYGVSHWQQEYNNITTQWFPVRTTKFLRHLRARSLFPAIDAPLLSQHGGSLPAGHTLTMTVPATVSKIYYQFGPGDTDPSDYAHSLDPRLVGGGIHPAATLIELEGGGGGPGITPFITSGADWKYLADGSNQGTAWQAPGFNDAAWPSGPSPLGYGDGDEATVVGFIDTDPAAAGDQRNATTYFRRVVNIPDPTVFADFTLTTVYDDAIVVYVNGVAVESQNLAANPASTDYTANAPDNSTTTASLPASVFRPGANTIAVEIHQSGPGSSDISFDLTLTGNPPGSSGLRTTPPLTLPTHGWLLARSYDSTSATWSALNSAYFTVNAVPASATNLVVSEIHYHPAEPPADAVSTNRDEYEFIELRNVLTTASLDLTGVRFTAGITFDFAANSLLPPGGRMIMVSHKAAFDQRYGLQTAGRLFATNTAGTAEYNGRLNNAGEVITLVAADQSPIHQFAYDNDLPWPPAADGLGSSLVLKHPTSPVPDHGVAANWVASRSLHGAPGEDDPFGLAGDPAADRDGDGVSALLEYALGTLDSTPGDTHTRVRADIVEAPNAADTTRHLTLQFTRNLMAHNAVNLVPEISSDLVSWQSSPAVEFVSEENHGDGTSTVTWRSTTPMSATQLQAMRIKAVTLP